MAQIVPELQWLTSSCYDFNYVVTEPTRRACSKYHFHLSGMHKLRKLLFSLPTLRAKNAKGYYPVYMKHYHRQDWLVSTGFRTSGFWKSMPIAKRECSLRAKKLQQSVSCFMAQELYITTATVSKSTWIWLSSPREWWGAKHRTHTVVSCHGAYGSVLWQPEDCTH